LVWPQGVLGISLLAKLGRKEGGIVRLLAVILAALLVLIPPFQTAAQEQVPQAPPKVSVALREGDKVRVKTLVALSSATANVGDVFDGEVVEDIDVNGKVVIAKGASALGTITAVQRAGWLGRPGRLGFTFEYARAVDGQRARLRATQERAAQGNEALAWGLGIILFLPFLLIRGREMEVKLGTTFTTFVDRDITIQVPASPPDVIPPVPAQPPPTPSPAVTPAPEPPPAP